MRTADFDYDLPPELIAQTPATQRDQSRLLVVQRTDHSLAHRRFTDLPDYLHPGDVLVLNDSKVIRARLRGQNHDTGGEFEVLLLEENSANDWWAMVRPGKRAHLDTRIDLRTPRGEVTSLHAIVTGINDEGHRRLHFAGTPNITDELAALGEVPLPPYIHRFSTDQGASDAERYQTIYARTAGSVAAPTAGLHFTGPLLEQIRQAGVTVCPVTLHIGPGTFAPVKAENLSGHVMHEERFSIAREAADAINAARRDGRRVIAVGTTSLRVLESATADHGEVRAGDGRTRLFVHPPYRFRIVDGLLTNFHLPRSTLLMLVSAFASPGETHGRATILNAYATAVHERYRFFSYGDAMFIG